MNVVDRNTHGVVISLSKDEALIINNALNEICNGIEIPGFQARIGCDELSAQKLLSDFGSALEA